MICSHSATSTATRTHGQPRRKSWRKPLTPHLNYIQPVSLDFTLPPFTADAATGASGKWLVLSRASGSPEHDHDWQLEPSVQLLLPEERQCASPKEADTLLLLDATWEYYGEYSNGAKGFSRVAEITLRDVRTGALRASLGAVKDTPGSVMVTNAGEEAKDWYSNNAYAISESLRELLQEALSQNG